VATPLNRIRDIGSWSGQDIDATVVGAAVKQLRGLHGRAALQTAVFTLIALVDDDRALGEYASEVVRELCAHTPIRALVVGSLPASKPGVDVRVKVREVTRPTGTQVCVDDIFIQVRGPTADHLDFFMEPYTLPELPVVVWLPNRLPLAAEPLLDKADRVVVDSGRILDVSALAGLARLSQCMPVTDLCWVRQAPLRQLLAGLFMGAEVAPFLRGVRHVEVKGEPGSMRLMAGWLMSRLRLSPSVVHLLDADTDSIQIRAQHLGNCAHFALAANYDEGEVHAEAGIEGGPSYHRTVLLTSPSAAALIDHGLARAGRDHAWEGAVAAPLRIITV